jgi:hypothetical protein
MELIKAHDPDLILCPHADTWIPLMVKKARRYGLEPTFSRTGFFKPMASKSYWSYGKVNHKEGALIPEGRVLIDTAKSFVYAESGLKGVLMASRLSGLSPNLTSRFTPGTLISGYEVFEALRRGVALPFLEVLRSCPSRADSDFIGLACALSSIIIYGSNITCRVGIRREIYRILRKLTLSPYVDRE